MPEGEGDLVTAEFIWQNYGFSDIVVYSGENPE